jgi:purine-binding chemotaxis protein CheW
MIRELITFEVEGQVFGLDIMSIREIRAWSPTTRLPRVPSCRGRGQPARHRAARGRSCGPPRLERDRAHPRHAIIVTQMDAQIGGWIVDAVSDIVTVPEEALQPPPPSTGHDTVIPFLEGLPPSTNAWSWFSTSPR